MLLLVPGCLTALKTISKRWKLFTRHGETSRHVILITVKSGNEIFVKRARQEMHADIWFGNVNSQTLRGKNRTQGRRVGNVKYMKLVSQCRIFVSGSLLAWR